MNNENKYQFINNLPKEYHHILWDIMIKAECNHSVDRPKGLSKQECKLIMRFLYKLFNNIKEIQQENKKYKEVIDKTIELTKNLLKTEDRGYYQIIFKEILKSLGDKE